MSPARHRKALLSAALAGPAAADMPYNPHAGCCIDAPNGDRASGARLVTYPCHGGVNQQFQLGDAKAGSGSSRTPPNPSGPPLGLLGTCMSADGEVWRHGNRVSLRDCVPDHPSREFHLAADRRIVGLNNICVDIPGGSHTPGTGLIHWEYHGRDGQVFRRYAK